MYDDAVFSGVVVNKMLIDDGNVHVREFVSSFVSTGCCSSSSLDGPLSHFFFHHHKSE